ncbi:hypothetical protein [Halodesulfovibrio sp. MK-HDV]|jgi:hypothetical protein|uniref:hypothetical protein n=1 Tax=Halodesulfovibrio sp. MK-HDV TaxID=2599925 RepID=UPI0013704A74|nr:hypothetical protein [Halodesulfovibrio sp. MK-HDV]KAF1073885.1 hypothetical protein MKHDV_03225 [Halodesulfovibrio sp. MK-HDV]
MNRVKAIFIAIMLLASVSSSYGASITPEKLIQSFNLRTVYSSYAQTLKMYCADYPKDFFDKKDIKVTQKSVVFESKTRYLKLEILDEDLVEMTDIIKGRSYSTKSQHPVFFDEKNKDIRTNETYIDYEIVPCVPFTEKCRRDMEED